MNKTELKDLVKKYFNLTEINNSINNNKQVKGQSFTEARLADGTNITNMVEEDFEVGQELHVITEEGEHVLAPSGEHTTESGIVLTVGDEGIITGVKHPDAEGEGSLEASEEKMAQDGMVSSEDLIEAISELVMPEIEAMKSEMTQCMARLAKAEEMMAKYEEKMSATPATESKTTSKFSKQSNSILNGEGPKYNKRRYETTLAQLTNR